MMELTNALTGLRQPFPVRFRTRHFDFPKNALFSSLSRQQSKLILPYLKQRLVKGGQRILEEGSRNSGKIYIILNGQVAISKLGVSPMGDGLRAYEIGVLKRGDIFGEASFVDGKPSAVTFAAKDDASVAVVDLRASSRSVRTRRLRNIVTAKLRRYIAAQAQETLSLRFNTLRIENELASLRSGVGHIVVATLSLLSFYTLTLSFLPAFKDFTQVNFAVTPLVILLFAFSFVPIVATSGFPLGFFGLTLTNWRPAAAFSLKASGMFIAAFLGLKLILINTVPAFGDLPLIAGADVRIDGQASSLSVWYWLALIVYLMLTPMQEFVARSGIQAPLYAFLNGSEAKRRWCSILVSNLVFAAAHAHISLAFALAAFVPGILWGWIFARTNSLLATVLSHIAVGGSAMFIFGVEGIVAKLT